MKKSSCDSMVEKFDVLGVEPPQFNLEGKKKIKSKLGFFLTICLCFFVILFTVVKVKYLVQGRKAIITKTEEKHRFKNQDDPMDLTDDPNFMVAFSVYNLLNPTEVYKDESKIKFNVWIREVDFNDFGSAKFQIVGTHKCTTSDYEKFYERDESQLIDSIIKASGFYCIDQYDVLGNEFKYEFFRDELGNNKEMIVDLAPQFKNIKETDGGETITRPPNWDEAQEQLNDIENYLKNPIIATLSNRQSINLYKYGADTIEKSSGVTITTFQPKKFQFQYFTLQPQRLLDESKVINLSKLEKDFVDIQVDPNIMNLDFDKEEQYQLGTLSLFYLYFKAGNDIQILERQCYDLVSLLSDVGGISAFLMGPFTIISLYFVSPQMMAVFANKAYSNGFLPPKKSQLQYSWCSCKKHDKKQQLEYSSESEILMPDHVSLLVLFNRVFCCCQSRKTIAMQKTLEVVQNDVDHCLDLLTVLRRLKAHGACLSFLLNARTRNVCTKIAGRKRVIQRVEQIHTENFFEPEREIISMNTLGSRDQPEQKNVDFTNKIKNLWQKDEAVGGWQKFLLGIYKKYNKIQLQEEKKEKTARKSIYSHKIAEKLFEELKPPAENEEMTSKSSNSLIESEPDITYRHQRKFSRPVTARIITNRSMASLTQNSPRVETPRTTKEFLPKLHFNETILKDEPFKFLQDQTLLKVKVPKKNSETEALSDFDFKKKTKAIVEMAN